MAHVDPELVAVLADLPDLGGLSDATLPAIRELLQGEAVPLGLDDGLLVEEVSIPSGEGHAIPGLLYTPQHGANSRAALLNIHGGGYVSGSMLREDADMRGVARAVGCTVLSVGYRHAPEHPFPAAHDDCHAAMLWLAAREGVDLQRLMLRGASAGGGLAMGLALRLHDEGRIALRLIQLIYPMLDDATADHPHNGRHVWTGPANAYGWGAYLRGVDRAAAPAYAVPTRAINLAGLPPVYIGTGAIDLFANEILAFAGRLIDAGVPTELHVWPGAYHGFNLVTTSAAAQALVSTSTAALHRALT
ncbi:alpha/beta hydrolase [Novosphingobium lentum]|uniref:alpha/beta hydrolase n=1 Tax=Novosphingobium lentum TaxID=145287 RepID=UPI00082D4F78|nr:alpha/beta hydrolase [Novosphingobium lentum]